MGFSTCKKSDSGLKPAPMYFHPGENLPALTPIEKPICNGHWTTPKPKPFFVPEEDTDLVAFFRISVSICFNLSPNGLLALVTSLFSISG